MWVVHVTRFGGPEVLVASEANGSRSSRPTCLAAGWSER